MSESTKDRACCGEASVSFERVRFFPNQLLGADDLRQEQSYWKERWRRHNRLLHGWGIVCGARAKKGEADCEVVVEPGFILGPQGDEIVIGQKVSLDVCEAEAAICPDDPDPWCAPVREPVTPGWRYLAVRYVEKPTRPVSTGVDSCGCSESRCEYSRIRDSFELKALAKLPASYLTMSPSQSKPFYCKEPCPPCPSDPWVILAAVLLQRRGDGLIVKEVDCYKHRRQAVTWAGGWSSCSSSGFTLYEVETTGTNRVLSTLLDLSASEDERPATVLSMRRHKGSWVAVPLFFSVERGETLHDLLEREGEREYSDPATGSRYSLREILGSVNADPRGPLDDEERLRDLLEGEILRAGDLRVVRTSLAEALDKNGLERLDQDHLGSPHGVRRIPATELKEVGPDSLLGRVLTERNMTIGDLADTDDKELVRLAAEVGEEEPTEQLRDQIRRVLSLARRAMRLSERW